MKPPCTACEEGGSGERLSDLMGRKTAEDLLYGFFNPEGLSEGEDSIDLEQMIQSYMNNMDNASLEDYVKNWISGSSDSWVYRSWIYESLKREKAREEAWRSILEKIRKGELDPSKLSPKQLIQNFPKQVAEALSQEGLLEMKLKKILGQPKLYVGYLEYTEESERIIARKVLEEALLNLEKMGIGIHELQEPGYGTTPSSLLWEYEEYLHSYDHLDIQETMINTALRDPQEMRIDWEDLKVRLPHHKAKMASVILLDVSYSMYGSKFKGGVMASLALRQLFEEEFKEDILHLVAYNDEPYLVQPGEVLKLKPEGNTDIGRALDMATQLLSKEEGNKQIFLITDSEPTVSYAKGYTPEENAYRASYMAGRENVRLNIIMLDPKEELRKICEQMAILNGNSTITYVENPLNLKEFMIKTFTELRRLHSLRSG